MSDNDLKVYPHGKVAIGGGDLMEATNARYSFTNGAKLKHTLRATPSGVTFGNKEVTGSVDLLIPEAGPEINVIKLVKKGNFEQFRFKDPTETDNIEGVATGVDKEYTTDDGISVTLSFIGKLLD